jgi:uncharacterized membrane protein YfcA
MVQIAELLLIGITIGLMSSVIGLGGGVVIVPALSIYIGFTHHEAVAASLMTIGLVTGFNVLRFHFQRKIHWGAVFVLVSSGAAASFISGTAASYFSEPLLIALFIVLLVFLITKTLLLKEKSNTDEQTAISAFKMMQFGSFAGFISGLTGVGGGSILTPILLSNRDIQREKVIPMVNVFMMTASLFGALAFALESVPAAETWQIGAVHLDAAFIILAGALPSAWFGTKIHDSVSVRMLSAMKTASRPEATI